MGQKYSALSVEIIIINKDLRELPENRPLSDFVRLKKIDLSGNRLSLIPPPVYTPLNERPKVIETLVSLNLSNNRLKQLPQEICLLINLKRLKLEFNRLRELPLQFHALYKLEKLTLNDNELTSLPPNLVNLKRLKILRLENNQLTYIPNDIGELENLKELTIHGNPLDKKVLEMLDLDSVLAYFRRQQIPPEYKRAMKALKKQMAGGNHEIELKNKKMKYFKKMLADARARQAFMSFLQKQYAAENLHFYLEVESFRQKYNSEAEITTRDLINDADKIYQKYIHDATASQINIPDNVRRKITALWEDTYRFPNGVNQWVFNEAQATVLELMFTDKLPAFTLTEEGRAVWALFDTKKV